MRKSELEILSWSLQHIKDMAKVPEMGTDGIIQKVNNLKHWLEFVENPKEFKSKYGYGKEKIQI